MACQSYKDLKIYQRTYQLCIEIHEMSLSLPKFELYEEGSQIRRSSKSVVANIAEGFGRRRYKNEFIKFLVYAQASCDETKIHLKILYDTKSLKDGGLYQRFTVECDELGKMIGSFIRSVEEGHLT